MNQMLGLGIVGKEALRAELNCMPFQLSDMNLYVRETRSLHLAMTAFQGKVSDIAFNRWTHLRSRNLPKKIGLLQAPVLSNNLRHDYDIFDFLLFS